MTTKKKSRRAATKKPKRAAKRPAKRAAAKRAAPRAAARRVPRTKAQRADMRWVQDRLWLKQESAPIVARSHQELASRTGASRNAWAAGIHGFAEDLQHRMDQGPRATTQQFTPMKPLGNWRERATLENGRKKPRTAAQKRAARNLVAWNRQHRGY